MNEDLPEPSAATLLAPPLEEARRLVRAQPSRHGKRGSGALAGRGARLHGFFANVTPYSEKAEHYVRNLDADFFGVAEAPLARPQTCGSCT